MKLTIAPLAKLLERAELRTKVHFHPDTMDLIHMHKRTMAHQVLAGALSSAEFQQAAVVEGVTVETLAETIVSKPDSLMEKENARRALVVKLRQAKTGAELDQILVDAGVSLTNLVSDVLPSDIMRRKF